MDTECEVLSTVVMSNVTLCLILKTNRCFGEYLASGFIAEDVDKNKASMI
jgi:hypothetical protein